MEQIFRINQLIQLFFYGLSVGFYDRFFGLSLLFGDAYVMLGHVIEGFSEILLILFGKEFKAYELILVDLESRESFVKFFENWVQRDFVFEDHMVSSKDVSAEILTVHSELDNLASCGLVCSFDFKGAFNETSLPLSLLVAKVDLYIFDSTRTHFFKY